MSNKRENLKESILKYFEAKKSGNFPEVEKKYNSANISILPKPVRFPKMIEPSNDGDIETRERIDKFLNKVEGLVKGSTTNVTNINNNNKIIKSNFSKNKNIKNYNKSMNDKKIRIDLSSVKTKVNNVINKNGIMQIPSFSEGGFVGEPTLAVVGDATDASGKPEGEVIMPESEFVGPISPEHGIPSPLVGPPEPEFDSRTTTFEGPTGRVIPKIPFSETDAMKEHNEEMTQRLAQMTPQENLTNIASEQLGDNAGLNLSERLQPGHTGLDVEALMKQVGGMAGGIGGISTPGMRGAGVNGVGETSSGGNHGGSGRGFLRGGHLPIWRMLIG